MRGLRAAVGMFTVLPAGRGAEFDETLAPRVMAAFPWVGLLVGSLSGAVLWLAGLVAPGWLPAVLGVAVLAALTGALHLDGVADTADGLGSRRPAAEALVIMRRSDIGPMGVVALVLVLLLQMGALGGPEPYVAGPALAAAAMAGRLAVVHASRGPGARSSGFGALFTGATSWFSMSLNTAAVALVTGGLGFLAGGAAGAAVFVGALAGAVVVGWLWSRYLAGRFGGMTGDTFGSVIEMTQTALLVLVSLAAGWV